MRIEPSGVVMIGECEIQTPFCTALTPAPITAVWTSPGRRQVDVCRSCLDEMVRLGEWEISGAKISQKYDIAAYDHRNHLQLAVEVKKRPYEIATNWENWATRIRRNLLVHSGIPSSVYFLLAIYPAPFCLWTPEDAPDALPSYSFDVQTELHHYEPAFAALPDDYRRQEATVSAWLSDLMAKQSANEGSPAWLTDSGLAAAIQGGSLISQRDTRHRIERQAA